jgi:hypothetical protein
MLALDTGANTMDPLTNLYTRLREQRTRGALNSAWPDEPPRLEDWLNYWNDDDTDLGNLRNFEHWLARARPPIGSSPATKVNNGS